MLAILKQIEPVAQIRLKGGSESAYYKRHSSIFKTASFILILVAFACLIAALLVPKFAIVLLSTMLLSSAASVYCRHGKSAFRIMTP